MINFLKAKNKEIILKAAREKELVTCKRSSLRLSVFSPETLEARKRWANIFKVLKEKPVNKEYYIQQNCPSKVTEKLKHSK